MFWLQKEMDAALPPDDAAMPPDAATPPDTKKVQMPDCVSVLSGHLAPRDLLALAETCTDNRDALKTQLDEQWTSLRTEASDIMEAFQRVRAFTPVLRQIIGPAFCEANMVNAVDVMSKEQIAKVWASLPASYTEHVDPKSINVFHGDETSFVVHYELRVMLAGFVVHVGQCIDIEATSSREVCNVSLLRGGATIISVWVRKDANESAELHPPKYGELHPPSLPRDYGVRALLQLAAGDPVTDVTDADGALWVRFATRRAAHHPIA